MTVVYVLIGTIFGFVLSRSGAADYDFIRGMFLFTNLQLYGIIGTAIVVAARPGFAPATARVLGHRGRMTHIRPA